MPTDLKKCPHCAKSIHREDNFCTYCGKRQPMDVESQNVPIDLKACTHCAALIQREAKVCRYCGKHQPVLVPKRMWKIIGVLCGIMFVLQLVASLIEPHHYTEKFNYTERFTTDDVKTVFPLSHKFIPNTLKVYFTPPIATAQDWNYVLSHGINKFIENTTSLGRIGRDYEIGPEGKSIIITTCALANVGWNGEQVYCNGPQIPYGAGWDIEADYDSNEPEHVPASDVAPTPPLSNGAAALTPTSASSSQGPTTSQNQREPPVDWISVPLTNSAPPESLVVRGGLPTTMTSQPPINTAHPELQERIRQLTMVRDMYPKESISYQNLQKQIDALSKRLSPSP